MIRVKNVSAYLDESFILRMRVVPRSEQISSSLFGDGDFLCNRKLRSYYIKKLSGDSTAAETKDVARATRRRRRILQTEFIFMKE